MKKKEFLTEAKRKAIIADKEKAIIESFAKTFNKIKRIDERRINEDLTLQYADRPSSTSPIVEIGYEDDGILYKFGFNFREDEELSLSDLFRGIETAKRGIQDAIEGASDLSSFDFKREIELVKKLEAFAKQSKMDNNNVVMLKSNMNHPNQDWTDKEDKAMNHYHDYMAKQDDYDSYKYQGLSEYGGEDYDLEDRKQQYGINPEIEPENFKQSLDIKEIVDDMYPFFDFKNHKAYVELVDIDSVLVYDFEIGGTPINSQDPEVGYDGDISLTFNEDESQLNNGIDEYVDYIGDEISMNPDKYRFWEKYYDEGYGEPDEPDYY